MTSEEQVKLVAKPEVGIVFMHGSRLWIEGTPVDEAEAYGGYKGHGRGHDAYWQTLQLAKSVPRDIDYDEVPRGRVGYSVKNRKYYLLLDQCIMDDERVVDKIFSAMHLPYKDTVIERDPHYRCPTCMRGKKTPEQLKQEEEDWDI